MKKIRDSRFELLRIVSISMIVLSHFSQYGQSWRLKNNVNSINLLGSILFQPLGQIGVYLFVLITGFFLGSREINFRTSAFKFLQIWFEVFFYSSSILFLFLITDTGFKISIKTVIRSLVPFSFGEYWFVSAYMMLLLLTPFLNFLIKRLRKNYFKILIVSIVLFNNVFPVLSNQVSSGTVGFGAILSAYFIGTYIRLYGVNVRHKKTLFFFVPL
ncbi:acyltransferase [Oenococcus sp. UCMA 16435]|nr:acyltransferase [Oenococcus sp. UCMA 16435]